MKAVLLLVFCAIATLVESKNHKNKEKMGLNTERCKLPISSTSSLSSSSPCLSPFSPKCVSALAEVVHVPKSCANRYLQSISYTLRAQSPLLFTNQLATVIANFQNSFKNVKVTVIDAFGTASTYTLGGSVTSSNPPQYSNTAKNYINFEGFVRAPESSNNFFYSFLVTSRSAELLQITLLMSINDDPIFC